MAIVLFESNGGNVKCLLTYHGDIRATLYLPKILYTNLDGV